MKIKNISGITISLIILNLIFSVGVYACTGVYVGKDVSADGSVIIARTEDMTSSNSKRFIVHPSKEYGEDDYFTDAYGLKLKQPKRTYRYTALPGSSKRHIGKAPFGAAGFNETGLAATSTVTGYPSEKAIAADPYTKSGLYELSANDVILSRASTARGAIELVADIIDEHGSGEGNIIMVADKNEAWYMEIYTGHQYAAIKLPDDKAAVIPNAFMLGEIDVNSEDVIVSENLVSLAKQKGFLKETNGKINLRETYAEPEKDSNSIRIWGGKRLLYGNVEADPYKTKYELLFEPSKKISVKDVMNVTRSRYEGTKYHVDAPGNKYIRPIGTSRQEECHLLQIRPSQPEEISGVMWLCLANSEFTAYVPYYATYLTDTPPMCKLDSVEFNEGSMYWAVRSLSTIAALDRMKYGRAIKAFYDEYENNLISYLSEMDKEMTRSTMKSKTADELCRRLTYDAYNKTREVYRQLIKFIAEYEGEDEFKDNDLKFEIDLSTAIDEFVPYTTDLPTVVTTASE